MQRAAARSLRETEHASNAHRAPVTDHPPARRRTERVRPAGGRFERPQPATSDVRVAERRTITITGQPVPPRRRRSPTEQRIAARPDRVALWAFLLGLFLALVAAVTAGAAPA